MDSLKCLLDDFKTAIESKRKDDSQRIIHKIIQFFEQELSAIDYSPYLATIFDKTEGILVYPLRKYDNEMVLKTHLDTCSKVVKICEIFIKDNKEYISPYVEFMIDCNLIYFRNTTSSKIRAAILSLITEILKTGPYKFKKQKLDFDVYNQLQQIYYNSYRGGNTPEKVDKAFGEFIGTVCVCKPEFIRPEKNSIRTLLLEKLDLKSLAISGYLYALTEFLKAFPPDLIDEKSFYITMHKKIKKVAENSNFKKAVYQGLMMLIKENGHLFSTLLLQDQRFWNGRLFNFLEKDFKLGFDTISSFYKHLSNELDESNESIKIFKDYFEYFKMNLMQDQTSTLKLRLALRGFGYFARVRRIQGTTNDVKEMFRLVLQKFEYFSMCEMKYDNENLEFLPEYILALSSIVSHLDDLSEEDLITLQRMNILMIRMFPYVPILYHDRVVDAFQQSLILLNDSKDILISKFLENILYQGIIWTCSHTMVHEDEFNVNVITYKTFVPFWDKLIKSTDFQACIYDHFLKTLFSVINKLDLCVTINDDNTNNLDLFDLQNTRAQNQNDFRIFINIVEFYGFILITANPDNFQKYANLYFENLIHHCFGHPLISGFYKLIGIGLTLLGKLEHKNCLNDKCQMLLNMFLFHILGKYQEFRDDLQLSMIEMILACPIYLLTDNLHYLPDVINTALDIGQTYLNIALKAIDVLENWCKNLSYDETTLVFTSVMPSLDKFLKAGPKNEEFCDQFLLTSTSKTKKITNKKISLKIDPDLLVIQQKILTLLGSLNYELRNLIINVDSTKTVANNLKPQNKLIYQFPMKNMVIFICLDEMLPRILELALRSSDRKVKLNACEVLHAFTIYLVGQHSKQITDNYKPIFEILFQPILELGCESDPVVRQLFYPLVIQLIHWITSRSQLQNSESTLFLNTLMNLITHPKNNNLRHFCGECLHEFTTWSLKQGQEDLINLQEIVTRIITLSTNPSSHERYGAALAFNNIHHIIRDQEVIDVYLLEILYSFLISLSYNSVDGVNCTQQVMKALDNGLDILKLKYKIFQQTNPKRRKPHPFKSSLLNDAVEWLLTQCGVNNYNYSTQCQKMFSKLTRYVDSNNTDGYNSSARFISNFIEMYGRLNFILIVESSPQFQVFEETNLPQLLHWLQQLHVSLNCYVWLLKNEFITINKIFSGTEHPINFICICFMCLKNVENKIFHGIIYFLNTTLFTTKDNYRNDNKYSSEINDLYKFDEIKMSIILTLFDFLLISGEKKLNLATILENVNFQKLLNICMFHSYSIGFVTQTNFDTLISKLNGILALLCNNLNDKIPFLTDLKTSIQKINVMESITLLNQSNVIGMEYKYHVNGLILLKNSSFMYEIQNETSGLLNQIFKSVIMTSNENQMCTVDLSLATIDYYTLILDYVCSNISTDEKLELLRIIKNENMIKQSTTNIEIPGGIYFFTLFHAPIMKVLIKTPTNIVFDFVNIDYTFRLIKEMINYLQKENKSYCKELIDCIAQNWNIMEHQSSEYRKRTLIFILKQIICHVNGPKTFEMQLPADLYSWCLLELNKNSGVEHTNMSEFDYKMKILEIIFLSNKCNDENVKIRSEFNTFLNENLKSTKENILDKNGKMKYMTAFNKIIDLFKITSSIILLENAMHMALELPNECKNILENALEWKMKHSNDNEQITFIYSIQKQCLTCITKFNLLLNYFITTINFARKTTIKLYFEHNMDLIHQQLQNDMQAQIHETLCKKIIALLSLQYYYLLDEQTRQSILHKSSLGVTEIEFCKIIAKHCFVVSCNKFETNDAAIQNLYRFYVCISYNTLTSIVCNTETNLNMYKPLFQFDSTWSKIIDCSINFTFPQHFEEMPAKKNRVIFMRRNIRRNMSSTELTPSSVDYQLSTQNVISSSLATDIAKHDFSTTILRTSKQETINTDASLIDSSYVNLELDAINSHECMPIICALISHVCDLSMDENNDSLPEWLQNGIIKTLKLPMIHKNIKLFVLKIIENNSEALTRYAKWLVAPIIQQILNGIIGDDLNYFTIDLILMLIKWNCVNLNSEDQSAYLRLFEFVVDRVYNVRNDLYKYNLEILKSILEIWKQWITPSEKIIEFLYKYNIDPILVDLQIQTSMYLLKNNIPLWVTENQKMNYLNNMMKYMSHADVNIYANSTELMAHLLKIMDATNQLSADFTEKVKRNIEHWKDKNTFFNKLYAMHKHFPIIIDSLIVSQLINNEIKSATLTSNIKLLKIIAVCWPNCYDRVQVKQTANFVTCLNHTEVDIQFNTLSIFEAISNIADTHFLADFIDILSSFVSHPNSGCRSTMFSIMKNIYRRFSHRENELFNQSKKILQSGLIDVDENIRKDIYRFWYEQKRNDSIFVFMLNLYDLFAVETEKDFLAQYLWCFIEFSSETDKFKEKIFDTPLADCNYSEYKIMLKHYAENASLTPLFVNNVFLNDSKQNNTMQILASNSASISRSTDTGDSMVSDDSSLSKYSTHSSPQPMSIDSCKSNKRFLTNQNRANKVNVLEIHNKKFMWKQRRQERMKQKHLNISLQRKYRKGDFPDIEITNEDLIRPLQMLIQRDAIISKTLFVSIFNGLVRDLTDDATAFLETINSRNIFSNILSKTSLYLPTMIGALFELVLQYKTYFNLTPDLITNASKQSGLLSLGCLLIEEKLIMGFDDQEPPVKRSTNCFTLEMESWLKLTDLYKNMAEMDYVYGIMGEKINNKDLWEAFVAELNNKWHDAREIYKNKIDNYLKSTNSLIIRDFYYDSYFNCFAQLAEWSALDQNLEKITNLNEVWEDDWNQETVLPWIMKTQIHNLCQNQIVNNDFLNKLCEWLKDKTKSIYLERNFCKYLILFSIWGDNYQRAKSYIVLFERLYLNDWMDISNKHNSLKMAKLDQLQLLYDIQVFLNTCDNLNAENSLEIINLSKKWSNVSQMKFRSLASWENTLWYRFMFTKKILSEIKDDESKNDLIDTLNETIANITIEIMNFSLNTNNCAVCRKYNTFITKNLKHVSLSKPMLLKYELAKSRLYQLNNIGKNDNSILLKSLTSSWKLLNNNELNNYPELKIQAYVQKHDFLNQLLAFNYGTEFVQQILSNRDEIIDLNNMALNTLLEAKLLCVKYYEDNKSDQKNKHALINVYLKIANYCRAIDFKNDVYRLNLIQSILKCMQLGSNDAVQLFPCLLLNSETYTAALEQCFIQESTQVPTWMFLDWIPQLLSAMNKTGSKMFNEILLRISNTYPKAMCYIYPISRGNFSDSIKNEELVLRLDKLFLKDDNLNTFLQALLNVNIPEVVVLYHLKKMLKILRKNDKNIHEQLFNAYQKFKSDCFSDKSHANSFPLYGTLFSHTEEYDQKIYDLLHSDKPLNDVDRELHAIVKPLEDIVKNKKIKELSKKLNDYSPWLANFQKLNLCERIEIPGQYSSYRKPLSQYHVFIVSVKKHVSIISSLRKPIKIIIIGSDAKEYSYLIKFGEDLRQDQRIEQLFSLMNTFLQKSVDANKMAINTYKIIPLSDRLGMIEWLDNTESFHEFGFKTNEHTVGLYEMRAKHKSWIHSVTTDKITEYEAYALASIHYDQNITIQKFNEHKYLMPWDSFRTSFMNISATFEDFFFVRHEFIKSYATIAVAQWILGVGDRHLSNTLVSLKTGQVIAIDFGYAFGIATQILGVPELVPFRLTPQIINVMKPFEESGVFKLTMIKTLRTIRKNKDLLLSLMDVFIQEPTTDWLEIANSKFVEYNVHPIDWYPKKKIDLAKLKLEGANPTSITIDELNDNYNIPKKEGYIKCLQSRMRLDLQGHESHLNLTVEKQVDCLLNQAMDPNLLGRMYSQWDPFI